MIALFECISADYSFMTPRSHGAFRRLRGLLHEYRPISHADLQVENLGPKKKN